MGVRRSNTPCTFLLLVVVVVVLQETQAYLLDPNTVAQLEPPKDFVASPFFNGWARYIVAGIGFSFLHAAGVILAIKRKENKIKNLEDYYEQLEEYFSEGPERFPEDFPDVFPLPDDLPTHDFPFPAELPGPGGLFGYKYVRPSESYDSNYDIGFLRRGDGSDTTRTTSASQRSSSSHRRHQRSLQSPPVAEDLQETLKEILKEEDLQEVVMRTAGFVQEVLEQLDEDGCLLKLLCHLQEKPKDTRAPEEELLMSLYLLKVPKGTPTCPQESFKCPMNETQLLEAFSYTWRQNNAA